MVEFYAEIKHETKEGIPDEGAVLLYDGDNEFWVPKKLIKSQRRIDNANWEFEVPDWFAEKEGII